MSQKKRYTHRSQELDQLLGQRVRITFWNDTVVEGTLFWARRLYPEEYIPREDYSVENTRDNFHFRKTHVKKIERL